MTPFARHTVVKVALLSACAALAGFAFVGSLLALPEGSLDPFEALVQLPGWIAGGGIGRANALAPLAGILAACAIWGIWVHQALRGGTFRRGEEHGSSRWGTVDEGKGFMNREDPSLNIPLTKNIGIPVSRPGFDLETDRNRNICVVGTPGTGKTRSHVLPLLMQMNASYLVTDPKGTLIGSTGWMFQAAGYRIRNFDLVRMEASSHYNPLAYVRTDIDVLAIVECLITNTTGDAEHTGDPFWENAERLLYTALIAYLIHHCPPEDRSLPGMLTLLSLAEAREGNESYMSPLDLLFHELETGKRLVSAKDEQPFDENSRVFANGTSTVRWVQVREPAEQSKDFALNAYKRFKTAAGETLKSIIISCNTRCLPMMADNVQDILADDELHLDAMGGRRAEDGRVRVDAGHPRDLQFLVRHAHVADGERAVRCGDHRPRRQAPHARAPGLRRVREHRQAPRHRQVHRGHPKQERLDVHDPAVLRAVEGHLRRGEGAIHQGLLRHDAVPGVDVVRHQRGDLEDAGKPDHRLPHSQRHGGTEQVNNREQNDLRATAHAPRRGGTSLQEEGPAAHRGNLSVSRRQIRRRAASSMGRGRARAQGVHIHRALRLRRVCGRDEGGGLGKATETAAMRKQLGRFELPPSMRLPPSRRKGALARSASKSYHARQGAPST